MRNLTRSILAIALAGAASLTPAMADTLNVCVNRQSGEMNAIAPGEYCRRHQVLVQLQAGPELPPPVTPPAQAVTVEYVTGGIYPNTSVARAFCPPGTKVAGGGGITSGFGFGLQQSFPISDLTGVIAYGDTAIGWQAAADDFSFAQAFVVCVH